jgi:sugar lactone lactonase YvrE
MQVCAGRKLDREPARAPKVEGYREVAVIAPRILLDGLVFPESPRWHEGRLWFSDMFGHRVMTVGLDGQADIVSEFSERPSGLGFLPDGTPLAVLMDSRRVVRLTPGGPQVHADLSAITASHLNDMVVDSRGRAYVDCVMHPVRPGEMPPPEDRIILVEPNGEHRVVMDGLVRPNGLVISGDGQRLLFGSVPLAKVTVADIQPDGSLTNPRVFAQTVADGICLDAEGAVWVGTTKQSEFRRVREGGAVADTIRLDSDKQAVACVLGGPDRRMLFMTTALTTSEQLHREHGRGSHGFIEIVEVEVPGAGNP